MHSLQEAYLAAWWRFLPQEPLAWLGSQETNQQTNAIYFYLVPFSRMIFFAARTSECNILALKVHYIYKLQD